MSVVRLSRNERKNLPPRSISIILRPSIWAEPDDHQTHQRSNGIEVHGDTKSITESAYHIETLRDSKCIKIVGALDSLPVKIAAAGARRTFFSRMLWTSWKWSSVRRFGVICPETIRYVLTRSVKDGEILEQGIWEFWTLLSEGVWIGSCEANCLYLGSFVER